MGYKLRDRDSTLEFKLTDEINKKYYEHIAVILNQGWGELITVDKSIIEQRFNSGADFVVLSDEATGKDIEYFEENGIIVSKKEIIPVGMLETTALNINEDCNKSIYDKIKEDYGTYNLLTNNGEWSKAPEGANILMLVDVTVPMHRRGEKSKGEGGEIIEFALYYIAKKRIGITHVISYSPNRDEVIKWHLKHGAEDTHYLIDNARPGFGKSDVHLTDYSKRIEKIRRPGKSLKSLYIFIRP